MKGQYLAELLDALERNPQIASRIVGITSGNISLMKQELQYLQNNLRVRDYALYTIKDKDYGVFKIQNGQLVWNVPVGIPIGWGTGLIAYPQTARQVGDELWVMNRTLHMTRFDSDFSNVGGFAWYNSSEGYIYGHDFVATDDAVYVVTDTHLLIKFDLEGDKVWQFGTYGNTGLPTDGLLHQPYFVDYDPNDQLVYVGCYYGRAAGANRDGYVATFDTDGNFQGYFLIGKDDGAPWNHAVTHPMTGRIYQNPTSGNYELWIAYPDYDCIGVFDLSTLKLRTVYGRDAGFIISGGDPYGIAVDWENKRLYVTLRPMQELVSIDLDSHNVINRVGGYAYERYNGAPQTPMKFNNISGVSLFNDLIVICDYNNERIHSIPKQLLESNAPIDLEYEGRDIDFEILASSSELFNPTTKTLRVNPLQILNEGIDPAIFVVGEVSHE